MGEIENPAETTAVLWATAAILACAVVATAVTANRARARVCRELVAERGSWLPRGGALAIALALSIALAGRASEAPIAAALAVLALAGALFAIRPSARDTIYGE